jgi:hypothetical protein
VAFHHPLVSRGDLQAEAAKALSKMLLNLRPKPPKRRSRKMQPTPNKKPKAGVKKT